MTSRSFAWTLAFLGLGFLSIANARLERIARRATTSLPAASTPAGSVPSPSCSQPVSFPNGDFEIGQLSPWLADIGSQGSAGPANISIVSPGYNSNYAVQISVGYMAAIQLQTVQACETTKYNISFAYKTLTAAASCDLNAYAYTSEIATTTKTLHNLQAATDWTSASFTYVTDLFTLFHFGVALECPIVGGSAVVQLDNISIAPIGPLAPSNCPKPITIPNSGFESGQLAPWTPAAAGDYQDPPGYSIISPGANSNYALQLDFQTAVDPGWSFSQTTTSSSTCAGDLYSVSFAVNWLNYTYPTNNYDDGCNLSVYEASCQPPPNTGTYFASTTPGWQTHEYVCQSSSNAAVGLSVYIDCVSNTPIPGFSMQLDDILVKPAGSATSVASGTLVPQTSGSPTSGGTTTATPAAAAAAARREMREVAQPRWV